MKHVIRISVLSILAVLALSGCSTTSTAPAAPTTDVSAIQTKAAQDVIGKLTADAPTATLLPTASLAPTVTTQARPTDTLSPSPTTALIPTSTPEPTKTPTPVPTKVSPPVPAITKAPVVATSNPSAASNADDKFYGDYASCIGGTDVVHFLSENSPGEIIEAYKSDRYNYTSTKQCEADFSTKVDALKQVHVCVLNLPAPDNQDLKAVQQSTIYALADLVKIREADFADRLCADYKLVLLDDARVAFANAQKHLQYAQAVLDKYRREQGK